VSPLGVEEPTHMPPRTYNAIDLQDGLLRARWEVSGLSDNHEEAHEALLTTMGSTSFSQFWQLHHLAIDSQPENQGVMERLVKWGLEIAEKRGLWVVVACHEEKKPFYEKLGFKYRGDYTVSVPGDDRELNLAWLQKDPKTMA
jgi:GNAT superfamily N-acetyltransferase